MALPPCALTIAGSDSGGGAGIQADLKTFAAHGVHGLSAIAALTAQNTCGVRAVHVPEVAFLRAQLDALFDDFDIGAIKLGMLASAAVIDTVAEVLAAHAETPVVLDPVMVATSGAQLLEPAALFSLRTRLVPRATVITPNIPEAELLLGHSVHGEDADAAVDALRALGAPAVLLKGGHLATTTEVADRFGDRDGRQTFTHARIPLEAHGTGCTLASAIAAGLCLGQDLRAACRSATDYVHGALTHAYRPGKGDLYVLGHFFGDRTRSVPTSGRPVTTRG